MSSQRSAAPLRIRPRPSRRLAILLSLAHGGGLLIVPLLPWPWWGLLTMASMLIFSLASCLARHVLLLHPRAVTGIDWTGEGRWLLTLRNGEQITARLAQDSYLHPQLVILSFHRGRWRRQSVVLCRDAVDQESFRRLRVRLGGMVCDGR